MKPRSNNLDKVKQVNDLRAKGVPVGKAINQVGIPRGSYYQASSKVSRATEKKKRAPVITITPAPMRPGKILVAQMEVETFKEVFGL